MSDAEREVNFKGPQMFAIVRITFLVGLGVLFIGCSDLCADDPPLVAESMVGTWIGKEPFGFNGSITVVVGTSSEKPILWTYFGPVGKGPMHSRGSMEAVTIATNKNSRKLELSRFQFDVVGKEDDKRLVINLTDADGKQSTVSLRVRHEESVMEVWLPRPRAEEGLPRDPAERKPDVVLTRV